MIYIIKAVIEGKNIYKVGFTKNNAYHRLPQLQTSCPVKLEMVKEFPGDRNLEAFLHRHLYLLRSHGEWFNDGELVQDLIKNGWPFKDENNETPRTPFLSEESKRAILEAPEWLAGQLMKKKLKKAKNTAPK